MSKLTLVPERALEEREERQLKILCDIKFEVDKTEKGSLKDLQKDLAKDYFTPIDTTIINSRERLINLGALLVMLVEDMDLQSLQSESPKKVTPDGPVPA